MIILFQLPWYSRTFINSNSTNSVLCNTLAHCAKRIRKWISEREMCHCANRIFSVTSVISHCAKRILIFFIGEHPLRKKNFQIWWSLRILRIFASLRKKNLSGLRKRIEIRYKNLWTNISKLVSMFLLRLIGGKW